MHTAYNSTELAALIAHTHLDIILLEVVPSTSKFLTITDQPQVQAVAIGTVSAMIQQVPCIKELMCM